MITNTTTRRARRVSSRLILPTNSTQPLKSALHLRPLPPAWGPLRLRAPQYLVRLALRHRHRPPGALLTPLLAQQRPRKWRVRFVRLLRYDREALRPFLCRLYLLGDHSTRHDWPSLTTDPLAPAIAGQASLTMTTTELNPTLHLMFPTALSICLLKITRLPTVPMSRTTCHPMSTSHRTRSSPKAKDSRLNLI
jgi:hypothetical protein